MLRRGDERIAMQALMSTPKLANGQRGTGRPRNRLHGKEMKAAGFKYS